MASVVVYVSGHGFGHASRVIEALNAFTTIAPETDVRVRTRAARWLFDLSTRGRVSVEPLDTDVGVVQIDSLTPDLPATLHAIERFYADFDARADAEARYLETVGPALVVADLPPLALAAAHRAGVPAFALGNFTWDWIYDDYAARLGVSTRVPDIIRRAHGLSAGAWRLPMHGGFGGFTHIVDVPFIARHATRGRDAVRKALGLPADRVLVLVSFGGFGLDGVALDAVAAEGGWVVVTTSGRPRDRVVTRVGPAVVDVDDHHLYAAGLRYEDLVGASDVVVTKPGYGIVSECIANGVALVYTERGAFAEYNVLVTKMSRYLRCAYLRSADLRAGRWGAAIERAMHASPPAEQADTNGAAAVAALMAAACR